MKRYLPFAIIAGVLVIALAGGAILWRKSNNTPTQPFTEPTPTATKAPQATPATNPTATPAIPVGPDNAHARGGTAAKVTLEEYGDYQCPPCGVLYPDLKTLEKEYGD